MGNDLLEKKIDTNTNKNLEQQEVLNFIKNEKNLQELGNYLSKTVWGWSDNLVRVSNDVITKNIWNIDKKVRWNQLLSVEEKALMKLKYAMERKEYPATDVLLNMYLGTNFWNYWYSPKTESVIVVKKTLEKKVESQSLPFLEYKKWYETASINNLLEWAKNSNSTWYETERKKSEIRNDNKDSQYKDDYIKYDLALYSFDLYSKLVTKKDREIQKKAWYSTEEDFTKQWELIASLSQALDTYKKEKFPTIDATFDKFKKYNDDINKAAKKAGYTTPEKQKESAALYTVFQKDSMKLVEQYNIQDIVAKLKNPELSSWTNIEEYFGNVNKMLEYTQAYEQLQQKTWLNTLKKYEWYLSQIDIITKKYGVDSIKKWWSDIEKYVAWVTALKNTYHGSTIDRKKYEDYQKLAQNSAIGRYTEWRYGLYQLLKDPTNKNSPFRGLKQEAKENEKSQDRTDSIWQTIKNINPAVYQILNFWASAWNGVVDFTVWTWSSLGLMLQSTYKNDDERKASADFKQSFDGFLKFNLSRSQSKPPLDEKWNWNLWLDNTVSQVWSQLANMVALLSGSWAIWRGVTKLWVGAMISQKIGLVSMAFMQQAGRSFEEGKTQWLDDGQALSYSMLQSSIGAGLELISPNQMMMGTGKKVVKEYIKNIIKTETKQSILQVWKVFTKNIVWEVLEENIQETMQLAVGNGINMWANDMWWTKFDANLSMDNFATTALLTTLTTGLWTSKQALSMWVASTQVLSPLQKQDLKQKIISDPVLYGQTTKVLNDIVSGKVQLEWVDIGQMKELQGELKTMESGKGEAQWKEIKGYIEENNNIKSSIDDDSNKQEIQNTLYEYDTQTLETHLSDIESKLKNTQNRSIARYSIEMLLESPEWFGNNDKIKKSLEILQQSENKIRKIFDKEFDRIYNMYKNDDKEYVKARLPLNNWQTLELGKIQKEKLLILWFPVQDFTPIWEWWYSEVYRYNKAPGLLLKIGKIPSFESIQELKKLVEVWKKINNPKVWLPIGVFELWNDQYAQIVKDVSRDYLPKELPDLSDAEAAKELYMTLKSLKREWIFMDRKGANILKTNKWYSIFDLNTIPANIKSKDDYYYLMNTSNKPHIPLIDLVSKHTWVDLKSYIKNNNSNLLAADIDTPNLIDLQPLLTIYPDILKNIVNPETLQTIIQSEISLWNLILNTDGSIQEVYTEVGGEKKPSQLFAKMKVDWFSEQQALKTWLQVRTPEFKNRFGDWQSTDKSQVSKVVDENGEPLMVYRRTKDAINEFSIAKNSSWLWKWIYFWYNKESKYMQKFWENIYPTFLSIKSLEMWAEFRWHKTLVYGHTLDQETENRINKSIDIKIKYYKGMLSEAINQEDKEFYNNRITLRESRKNNIESYHKELNSFDGRSTIESLKQQSRADVDQIIIKDPTNAKSAIDNDWSFSPETAKFNDYFWKESRFWFDSKQAREHSGFMDQFTTQAIPEQIIQIREKIQAVAQMYSDKTGKSLELTDAQIQTIIATHLKPGELGKLTQVELKGKVQELATAIPDADLRRFLLEAWFCWINTTMQRFESDEEISSTMYQKYGMEVFIKKETERTVIKKGEAISTIEEEFDVLQTMYTKYPKYFPKPLEILNNNWEKIIVMEKLQWKHLADIPQISIQNLFDLYSIITNLHEKWIVHWDLNPYNIMFDDQNMKIIDPSWFSLKNSSDDLVQKMKQADLESFSILAKEKWWFQDIILSNGKTYTIIEQIIYLRSMWALYTNIHLNKQKIGKNINSAVPDIADIYTRKKEIHKYLSAIKNNLAFYENNTILWSNKYIDKYYKALLWEFTKYENYNNDIKIKLQNVQKWDILYVDTEKYTVIWFGKTEQTKWKIWLQWKKWTIAIDPFLNADRITVVKKYLNINDINKISSNVDQEKNINDLWPSLEAATQQWGYWDCYLLATLESLKREPFFKRLMQENIVKTEWWWRVHFYGTSYKWLPKLNQTWHIRTTGQFSFDPTDINITNTDIYDWKKANTHIKSINEWDILLEVAYAKLMHQRMNQYYKLPNDNITIKDVLYGVNKFNWNQLALEGWRSSTVYKDLLWDVVNTKQTPIHQAQDIFAVSSKQKWDSNNYERQDHSTYIIHDIGGNPVNISYWHAYSVKSIDENHVVLNNPHFTWRDFILSLEEFQSAFPFAYERTINHKLDTSTLKQEWWTRWFTTPNMISGDTK